MTWFDAATGEPLRCATCGLELDGDPDEEPAAVAGLPTCGECRRAAEFDELDVVDGVYDGDFDS